MANGESLTRPYKIRKFLTALHAKANEELDRRFHAPLIRF